MQLISLSKLNIACCSSLCRAVRGQVKSRDQINLVAHLLPKGRILNHRVASLRLYCCNQINKSVSNASMLSSCHDFARISMSGVGFAAVTRDGRIMGCGIDILKPAAVGFGDRSSRSCRKTSLSLRNGGALCSHLGVVGVANKSCELRLFMGLCFRHYHVSCSQSNGAAADVPFDVSVRDEQHSNSADPSACTQVGQRTLKLRSGSSYLPHPDKVKTGGEDAHFICEEKQVIGVADGVGGWADVGVDAGQYARLLMFNSQTALKEEPKGSVDPAKVLEKAHADTKVIGSSTACIVALTDKGIHAINLGDSAFIVIRDGTTVFRSPVQQYGFNFPYQLASGSGGDLPSAGQVFTFPVAAGDVIVAGTDGLFDNLYDNEIVALVVQAMRSGIEPLITAQNIATLAQQRALDRHRQTPFSAAAHDAGIRYFGGKLDDITVVVSYITA